MTWGDWVMVAIVFYAAGLVGFFLWRGVRRVQEQYDLWKLRRELARMPRVFRERGRL